MKGKKGASVRELRKQGKYMHVRAVITDRAIHDELFLEARQRCLLLKDYMMTYVLEGRECVCVPAEARHACHDAACELRDEISALMRCVNAQESGSASLVRELGDALGAVEAEVCLLREV